MELKQCLAPFPSLHSYSMPGSGMKQVSKLGHSPASWRPAILVILMCSTTHVPAELSNFTRLSPYAIGCPLAQGVTLDLFPHNSHHISALFVFVVKFPFGQVAFIHFKSNSHTLMSALEGTCPLLTRIIARLNHQTWRNYSTYEPWWP